MKYNKLVNLKAISRELTGSEQAIKNRNTSIKYSELLEDLDDVLELWLKLSRRKLQPKQKQASKARRNTFNK